MTVSELVAFNLNRARRRSGMTQGEVAKALTELTGRRWTANGVGLAERSWDTTRVRKFDSGELVAFCRVFDLPLAYFFLPPDTAGKDEGFPVEDGGQEVRRLDLLGLALPLRPRGEFVERAQAAARVHGLSWSPARPSWYHAEEEGFEAAESEEGVVGEPRVRRAVQLLEEARLLLLPEDEPPF